MVRQARRRNASAVRAGRVDLPLGSVEALPDFRGPVDKILAVNSVFWQDPGARLKELREVATPEARSRLPRSPAVSGRDERDFSGGRPRDRSCASKRAGFPRAHIETLELDPPVVCVIAVTDRDSDNREDANP
jgi:hypothetical protein